jgi:hypothetical protein
MLTFPASITTALDSGTSIQKWLTFSIPPSGSETTARASSENVRTFGKCFRMEATLAL